MTERPCAPAKYGTLAGAADGVTDTDMLACLGSRYVGMRFGLLAVQTPYDVGIVALLRTMTHPEFDGRPGFKEWRLNNGDARKLLAVLPRIEEIASGLEASKRRR